MITTSVSGVGDILAELKPLADTRTIARMVNRDIAPPLERRLDRIVSKVAPPRTDVKFVWSYNRAANARARRWWFAAIKRGAVQTDGKHFLRTGVIPAAWQTEIAIVGDQIVMSLVNPASGSEFLYGSEERPQVPGHATTGWLNYTQFLGFIDIVRAETINAWELFVINTTRIVR